MRIFRYLFAAYVIAEIASLVAMGSWVGVGWTFLLLAAATVAGGLLISTMGAEVMRLVRMRSMAAHDIAEALPRAHIQLLAGILFIIPGFASDAVAIAALLPPVQGWLGRRIRNWLARHAPRPPGGDVIDGEAVEVEDLDAKMINHQPGKSGN